MYRFAYSFGLLLASTLSVLSDARHTVFISHTGEKTYLPSSSEADVCMTPTCVIAAADILTSLDEAVDPCDDFYSFACGGWMKRHEVTDDQPEMHTMRKTQDDLDRKLRDLLETKYTSSDPHFVKMMKDFYNTCVDLSQGSEPLKIMLRRLGGWPVVEGSQWDDQSFDWVDTLISFRKLGYNHEIMLVLYVNTDPKNETVNMIWIDEPSLRSLRDVKVKFGLEDPKVAAYYKKMMKAAKLLGADESTSEKELLEALRFEMNLTNIMKKKGFFQKKGRKATVTNITELQEELPLVPWLKIINGLLLNDQVYENETLFNSNPDFLVKFYDLITSTDKRVIANYMLWQAVLESKDYLSEEWKDIEEDEEEDKSPKNPRWKECLRKLEDKMEIGVASYYVKHYFSDESKDESIMLMKYIHKEFLKILENNDWMDEETKKKAEEKLKITTDSYLENILAFSKWEMDKSFSKLRKNSGMSEERTGTEFSGLMDVNAYYQAWENTIAIPAGILHDAFYDKDRPKYMNFGAIGYLMGHEIIHGFDNQGRKYDKDGRRVKWWDKESEKHFIERVKCIIEQYDNYTTDIGLKVNGRKTQNENIADNGGLKEAYRAYNSWTKDHGIEPLLPGVNYTQNQVFWLSAAHVWCSKYQPERLKELLLIDEHSPGKFRIIGPMSNLAEFSKDFKCSPDAPMNRKNKCHVW